ncbi:PREDICTED: cold and drought-regulated protein CORA-like isoform X2 [Lupinus angustifolius]|uniref:cold and drought-regulated protein CORA-like isoform X2 n=1 Tax=Lupinus angustifolius TaxID=3871 RepID=UPI00092F8E09|nr:PREDICTED: cold and drought-regulated protein CORA-like isoform X2 [Lupinus angustifolius]
MGRGLGFQPQQGYGFHQDSWGPDHNNYQNQHGNNGVFHDTIPNANYGHHGYDNFGHGNTVGQFPNGGAYKFNSGGRHGGYNSEEYEEYNEAVNHGAGKLKVDEVRYERHNYGGGDHGFHANPYGHGGHKADWIAKGV